MSDEKILKNFVVNKRKEKYDVYIGRPSMYGNPFVIGEHGTRKEVIEKYHDYVKSKPALYELIKQELKGKVLGCFCAPQMCHGDVLSDIANGYHYEGGNIVFSAEYLLERGYCCQSGCRNCPYD